MPAINRETSTLLLVDFQSRLMPAIDDGRSIVANARRLLDAAINYCKNGGNNCKIIS